jgi:Fe-S-cluster-containing hydrogenase component 2
MYVIEQEKCTQDDNCREACPVGTIEKKADGSLVVGEDCTDCGACVVACEADAIRPE